MSEQRREYERLQRQLQARLEEVGDELAQQRRELTARHEDAIQKHDHEYRVKVGSQSKDDVQKVCMLSPLRLLYLLPKAFDTNLNVLHLSPVLRSVACTAHLKLVQ